MNDSFKLVMSELVSQGFHQLPDGNNKKGKELDFNITNYSLNSKLSFKFDNLSHFMEFLNLSQSVDDDKKKVLEATMFELNIKPTDIFYVNFFEKGKELEM